MLNLNSSSFKVCFFIFILLLNNLTSLAQKPPTGGPNPDDEQNLTPIIIGGSALVLAAGSYFYLKSRGPKIAVTEHLPTYLLSRNILPTTDAINLMYKLNPSLNNKDLMRAKKKLIDPDFPEIPEDLFISNANAVQITSAMPADLKVQVDAFSVILNSFRNTEIILKSSDPNLNFINTNSTLNVIEKMLISPDRNNEESNTITNKFMTDLIRVLNKTLENSVATKILTREEMILINDISENLSDLLFPTTNSIPDSGESSQLQIRNPSRMENLYLASVDQSFLFYPQAKIKELYHDKLKSTASTTYVNYEKNETMKFAFSVHKFNSSGIPITKGPEVEGRYKIQYTMPALVGEIDTYLDAEGLATYALADLPGVKLIIIVSDISNQKPVIVLTQTIDFEIAFKYTGSEMINDFKHIVVTLYLSDD